MALAPRGGARPSLHGDVGVHAGVALRAAAVLGISRTALRYRLHTARTLLGAEDTSEAIRKAIDLGLLTSHSYAGMVKGLPEAP